MALSAPAARMAAGALFLLLLLPTGLAQVPPVPEPGDPDDTFVNFVVLSPISFTEVGYNSNAQVPLIIKDMTPDSGRSDGALSNGPGVGVVGHSVELAVTSIEPADAEGWQVLLGLQFVPIVGGQTVEVPVTFQTTPQINTAEISVEITALYTGPNGITRNQTILLGAEVARYDAAFARITNQVQRAGQDEIVRYEVMITNDGVYPDTYQITVTTDKENVHVIAPPNVYVPPKSTRFTNITVLTPKDKFYEVGQTAVLTAKIQSLSGTGAYPAIGIIQVRGPHVPVYWLPLILVGLASAGILTRERMLQSELASKERGRPRRVAPTPRQAVLLSELKRRDPDSYEQKKAAFTAVYSSRRELYRGEKKERAAKEREEHRQAQIELKERRRALKAEAKAAAAQRKVEKKAAKKQAKLDKKQEKVDAKARRKEEKVLAKRRKVLEKQKRKLEAQRAKAEKAAAKAQAKADKAAAREARKQARNRK